MVLSPMINKETQSNKRRGSSTEFDNNKTAVITIETPGGDDRTVEAQHYIKADDGTVSIYLGPRSEGIDIQAHISRCVIARVDTHEVDVRDKFDVDHVEYDGKEYRLVAVRDADTLTLDRVHEDIIDAPAEECVPVTDDQELIADGGHDHLAECNGHNCFTLVTDRNRDRCSECRERAVAKSSMTGLDDDGNDEDIDIDLPDELTSDTDEDDDQEPIADGGREINNGDTVLHAGAHYRVARVRESQCEIYRLGAGSEIVPLGAVEPVPEVQD